MDGLFRRGGIWSARLVVPPRLRGRAGRREFIQSTGTHEHVVGKLVAATLLSGWRRQLYEWERGSLDNEKLLQLVEGRHAIGLTRHISFKDAATACGMDRSALVGYVDSDHLDVFVRLGANAGGFVLPKDLLEPNDAMLGRDGGLIVPNQDRMPLIAQETNFHGQVLRVTDGWAIAGEVLAGNLTSVDLVLLDAPVPKDWVFAPSETIHVHVDELLLLTSVVESLRARLIDRISPEQLQIARAERNARISMQRRADEAATLELNRGTTKAQGKWANKKFSEAVDAYAESPEGLPANLASPADQRQRKAGLLVFSQLMGDLSLSEIDGDVLRKFRDGPLKTIPGRINTLPKEFTHSTLTATIEALAAARPDWPKLSNEMRHERMQWLIRFFTWLTSKEYLKENPAISLKGESGLTKAEKIAAKQIAGDEDEEGRAAFTAEQLKLIFSQLHYKTGHGKHVKKPAYWYTFEYWLPLLGLYGGLRIKEASQLHLADVREVDEVWCLDINRRTADKSLKNDQSVRLIPIHPELIRLGLLRYCDSLRLAGYKRVFPDLTWSQGNARYAKESGRKMSDMLKNLGMPRDGTLVYHCLRHNVNNELMRVPVSAIPKADEHLKKYIRLKVMGHEVGSDVNIRHYTKTTSVEMYALVSAVDYALPDIHVFDIEFALGQIKISHGKKLGYRKGREDMGPLNPAANSK